MSRGARPHVLYVTPMFGYPAMGGPRLRTYNTLKALARCADVSLYLTQQPDAVDPAAARAHLLTFLRDVRFPAPTPKPSLARRIAQQVVPATLRARLRRGRLPAADPVPASDAARDPAQVADLRAWIAARQPDVLWLGFTGISYDLAPLKEVAHTPLVLETECVWSRFILREAPYETGPARRAVIEREGRAKEAEERAGALLADVTTAVSEIDADYFRALAPRPESVMRINNVIDVDAYARDPAPPAALDQPAVLFAGTFSVGTANVDATHWLLDRVMPRVWARRPDVHLYLVGRHPAPSIVARRAPRVHVTGEVPSVVPFMRASRAALVPLRWESGTRFKILEAFACRTPVISTTLGAEGLDVEHGRHLLLVDAPDDFADAVLSMIDDPRLGQELIEPADALVRLEYDVSSAARQASAVLERLGLSSVAAR